MTRESTYLDALACIKHRLEQKRFVRKDVKRRRTIGMHQARSLKGRF